MQFARTIVQQEQMMEAFTVAQVEDDASILFVYPGAAA